MNNNFFPVIKSQSNSKMKKISKKKHLRYSLDE